jgi:hypothetical protein
MSDSASYQEYVAQTRLDKLEGMVRQISSAIGINVESASVADFERRTAEALKQLQHQTSSDRDRNSVISRGDSSFSSDRSPSDSAPEAKTSLGQSSLLDLFKANMVIETDISPPDIILPGTPTYRAFQSCVASIEPLLPTEKVLTSILHITEKFWPLWYPFPEYVFNSKPDSHLPRILLAKNFIFESLKSGSLAVLSRALLCLALCIQQLPAKSQQHQNLPFPANDLLDSYFSTAEILLSGESAAPTLEGVDCWLLLSRLYINAGKPRRAWLSSRRGMDSALLLGFHHPNGQTNDHIKLLWDSAWQTERYMSLLIGVPSAIAQPHTSQLKDYDIPSVARKVMLHISIACGYINERNRDPQNARYSTSEIEEELEMCRSGMPSEWWDDSPRNSSLQELYSIVGIKMRYLELVKHLHLPSVLRPCASDDQQRSKTAGLNAARDMIRIYQTFRRACEPTIIMCDLIDFVVFTGAVLVIINLLGNSFSGDADQDVSDCKLVNDVSKTLDHVSRQLECPVAGQAAQLLEYLSSSYQGSYSGPEVYEAAIPYFGKVRIRQHKNSSYSNSTSFNSPENPPTLSGLESVEFSIGQLPGGGSWSEAEVGTDWASVLNTDTTTYDWNYIFNNVGS